MTGVVTSGIADAVIDPIAQLSNTGKSVGDTATSPEAWALLAAQAYFMPREVRQGASKFYQEENGAKIWANSYKAKPGKKTGRKE